MVVFRPLCVSVGLAALLVGCSSRIPPSPVPSPEEAVAADSSDGIPAESIPAKEAVREVLGAEPERVGPALAPDVAFHPAEPAEGMPFLLRVTPASGSAPIAWVEGTAASRPLTFARGPGDLYWTVAPAPLDAGAVTVELTVHYLGGAVRTETRAIPIAVRTFPAEQLKVAERFTRPPPEVRQRIEEERALVGETVRRITRDALWQEPFAKPREDKATSPFGTRRLLNGQLQSRHLGYDIAGRPGEPVHASNRGRVVLARDLYFSGHTVYIDHGLGLFTAYFHMSEIVVQEGEWVERGQLIGRVGATGRVTGPHLHWSVSFQGIPLDPAGLLALGGAPNSEAASSPPP